MIKFIHRNKRFITVVFAFIAVCFMITGVGVDILHNGANPNEDLIEINGQELSAEALNRSERGVESRYRKMFGENFAQFASALNLNIRQQAIDSLIDRTILDQEASKLGFTASDDAVRQYLLTTFFKGENGESSFSPANYRNLLQSLGMSAPQFEQEIQNEIARTTLINILRDAAVPTNRDSESLLKRQKTMYSVVAATISTSEAAVPAPSETDLKKYYESHATEYEVPAQVSYSYITFPPVEFEKEVQLTPQDVEFFYSENATKYSTPEQTHARGIKLLYPKESDPQKMAAVREKATKAREEALSGGKFEDIVAKYSDDLPTKILGGDLGWIKKGEKPKAIDEALSKTAPGDISDLIETDYGFEIIKVEEKKAAAPRPLDEVRAEIEKEIRSREAPAYAANRAREILQQTEKDGKSLAESLPAGTTAKETSGALPQGKDPEVTLVGLTQNVFMISAADRLKPSLIELGELSVLVQVKEYKEPTTPPFEQVKDKVLATVKAEEALKIADTKAQELLKAAQANPATFTTEAQTRAAKIVGPFQISREEASSDKFPTMTQQMRTAVLNSDKPHTVVERVFSSGKEFTLLKVEDIKAPVSTDPKNSEELNKYKTQASQELANNMITSTLELFKSRSKIDVNPSLIESQ
jgi:peptidyl-prolyl cis-trans isomerase D